MMAVIVPSLVLFVDDVARVTAFYASVASMHVAHQAADHAVLTVPGLELVVHAMYGATAPSGTPAPVVVREDSYMKLALPVASLAAARVTAAAHGGALLPVEKEWSARGFRACDGHDPEGNVIQLREPNV